MGEQRYKGFRDAVRDKGAEELAENYVIAAFTVSSGYEKAGELLEKCKDLDGIVCATDTMAAGAVKYLRERGVKVPEQIMVAGQGDLIWRMSWIRLFLRCITPMKRAGKWRRRC